MKSTPHFSRTLCWSWVAYESSSVALAAPPLLTTRLAEYTNQRHPRLLSG
ncbi:hypothetical protein [Picosynechococcus sp. OG1]|nr:hypothetical protein [Picosynechococcus sp. OG1]